MSEHILLGLAVWRVTSLLVQEDCPFRLCAIWRGIVGVVPIGGGVMDANNQLGKLFTCIWCLSPWVGLIACLLMGHPLWYALVYSAIAIGVNQWLE